MAMLESNMPSRNHNVIPTYNKVLSRDGLLSGVFSCECGYRYTRGAIFPGRYPPPAKQGTCKWGSVETKTIELWNTKMTVEETSARLRTAVRK